MSENDDRSRDDTELEVNAETLEDLDVVDGDDAKGGMVARSQEPEDCTRTAC